MPNDKSFGALPIDPRDKQRTKIIISKEKKDKGKFSLLDKDNSLPTDQQFDEATIIAAYTLPPATFSLPVPPVLNQGSEGSCVSFSAGYYTRSIMEYTTKLATAFGTNTNIFSPEFLHNNIKSSASCGSGSSIITAGDFLKANGVCRFDIMPYSWLNGCSDLGSDSVKADAAGFKISSYSLVYANDWSAMKQLIMSNQPLSFATLVDNDFCNAVGPNYVWKVFGPGVGYHQMTIIGWDDSIEGGSWKVVNSWGTGWGNAGYCWIPYTFFQTNCASQVVAFSLAAPAPSNIIPTADAGYDSNVVGTSTTLNGSKSVDPDGYIKTYAWSLVTGPNSPTIVSPSSAITQVTGLVPGVYKFQLTVTDSATTPNTATDTVTITVSAAPTATASLSGSKQGQRHNLSWAITANNVPQSVVLEFNIVSTTAPYSTMYTIPTSQLNGSYVNNPSQRKKKYNYRIKIVDYDGTIRYSNIVTLSS